MATAPALVVPGYELGDRLGAGGFGVVYRAHHTRLGRDVAIKVLHAKYSDDAAAVARFVAEARAASRISHAGIVDVFDFGELADGRHYFVMELVAAPTLRDLLRERGALPLAEALPLLGAIAAAIDAAHAAGIVHRDLKPDNVFVLAPDAIKLIDFGLAKLAGDQAITETGEVFGTPLYMSPEQCRGRAITAATDAYSFGALAHHVLTGAPPFSGEALELALHHLNDPPPAAKVSPGVDAVLASLLAKDPAARPLPLARAVAAMTGGPPLVRRRRWPILAGALALVAVVAGGAVLALHHAHARSAPTYRARMLDPLLPGNLVVASVAADQKTLPYSDLESAWSADLDTGEVTRVREDGMYATTVPTGQRIVRVHEDHLTLTQPDGRRTVLPIFGGLPAVSPDGTRFAVIDPQTHALWIVTVATGDVRRIPTPAGAGAMDCSWSPDGTAVLWSNISDAYLTDLASGQTRGLGLPDRPLGGGPTVIPIPDDRIAYCVIDGARGSVRARKLGDLFGLSEERLADIPGAVSACGLTIAPSGRIVVNVATLHPRLVALDASHDQSALQQLELSPNRERLTGPVARDGSSVITFGTSTGGIADARQISTHASGADVPVALCPGDTGLFSAGAEVLHLAWRDGEAVVRDATCREVARWRLPATESPLVRCGGGTCLGAAFDAAAGSLRWFELGLAPPSTRELAGARRTILSTAELSFALSPGGDRAIVLPALGATPLLLDVKAGTLADAVVPEGNLTGVGWADDADHFVISSLAAKDHNYAAFRVGLDGTATLLWFAQQEALKIQSSRPETSIVAGLTTTFMHRLMVLDPNP